MSWPFQCSSRIRLTRFPSMHLLLFIFATRRAWGDRVASQSRAQQSCLWIQTVVQTLISTNFLLWTTHRQHELSGLHCGWRSMYRCETLSLFCLRSGWSCRVEVSDLRNCPGFRSYSLDVVSHTQAVSKLAPTVLPHAPNQVYEVLQLPPSSSLLTCVAPGPTSTSIPFLFSVVLVHVNYPVSWHIFSTKGIIIFFELLWCWER